MSLYLAPPPPVRYLANDGEGEPTLWEHAYGKQPTPIMRRCDLRPGVRDKFWPLIVEAVCGS